MSRIIAVTLIGLLPFLVGCVSTTRSYDAHGRLLGYCEAERAFFLSGSGAVCMGSSNPKDQGVAAPTDAQSTSEVPADTSCPSGQTLVKGRCFDNATREAVKP